MVEKSSISRRVGIELDSFGSCNRDASVDHQFFERLLRERCRPPGTEDSGDRLTMQYDELVPDIRPNIR